MPGSPNRRDKKCEVKPEDATDMEFAVEKHRSNGRRLPTREDEVIGEIAVACLLPLSIATPRCSRSHVYNRPWHKSCSRNVVHTG